ncbi:TlpA family protein disulfide reductase [Polyangium aurulentum]|uniref:TlpA family protein disulfide reductase n=1 Tax=Polyangium aurulentum TaxID=2567896 RepID=UPI001F1B42EC|nr:TlpA disulfide reductase family protein [Polyangium aurulentum]
MGRLSALTKALPLAALLTAGCEGAGKDLPPPPPVTGGRSNAVTAGTSTAATPTAATSAAAAPQAPAAPRKLCQDGPARSAPKGTLQTAAAPGAQAPGSLAFGVGKWVWVNLWAAWCGPCKEEMPRLVNFQSRLRTSGVMIDLAFVSLDDDERQLHRFLEGQPDKGVRASYWLPEANRKSWLGSLGVKETPELPVHALVNPSGQVTCVIQGAVEESDYQAIASLVGAGR